VFVFKVQKSTKAAGMLLFATFLWGTTFLLMKTLGQCQLKLAPNESSWFFSTSSLLFRFVLAFLIMLSFTRIKKMTRNELSQGLGLGISGGLGLIFQMDGVQYAPASTAAFLTQCYCVIIPVFMAIKNRRLPSLMLGMCCLMVTIGVTILAGLDWSQLRLGRGELETILASILFTFQILLLEKPAYAKNNARSITLVYFAVVALILLPATFLTAAHPADIVKVFSTPSTLTISLFLAVGCTLATYWIMNQWQPYISSTYASLIYCAEPVFASILALFFPAMLSAAANVEYANEQLTHRLIIGGGLILVANILVLWQVSSNKPHSQTQPG